MKNFKIYTAGKMGGLTQEEAMAWRLELERLIRTEAGALYSMERNITFIHPPNFYSYDDDRSQNEREMMVWELNQIALSDVVVVNLKDVLTSAGTLMELGAVQAINQVGGKFIPVVGIGERSSYLWVNAILWRRENTLEEAAKTVAEYLLV